LLDVDYYYSDNVLAYKTMPRNKVNIASNVTITYVSHKGAHSSVHWAEETLKEGSA